MNSNPLLNSYATAKTTNGRPAHATTGSAVLNLFVRGGSPRAIPLAEQKSLVIDAFNENPRDAAKVLMYLRDIRGGVGERAFVRTAMNTLMYSGHSVAGRKLIPHVPFFGRWDDLLVFTDALVFGEVVDLIARQLMLDLVAISAPIKIADPKLADLYKQAKELVETGETVKLSLLGKWLPSINASNKTARDNAKRIAAGLGLTKEDYRKLCSLLRKEIKIVENNLRTNDFESINYEHVPSLAMLKYRKVFSRKDPAFKTYMEAVAAGEKKINTSVTTPFDIVHKIRETITGDLGGAIEDCAFYWQNEDGTVKEELKDQTLIQLWNNLPNHVQPGQSAIVVCDTSGSMFEEHNAIDVALSLTLYFAERNKGPWQNAFFTFSDNSQLNFIKGNDIYERMASLATVEWGGSTNIISAFTSLLDHAVRNGIEAKDMPQTIFIVSDMQFDSAVMTGRCRYGRSLDETAFDEIAGLYAAAGYTLPKLVFWNANAKADNYPVAGDKSGCILVSGRSANLFDAILRAPHNVSPALYMRMVLDSPRYAVVEV